MNIDFGLVYRSFAVRSAFFRSFGLALILSSAVHAAPPEKEPFISWGGGLEIDSADFYIGLSLFAGPDNISGALADPKKVAAAIENMVMYRSLASEAVQLGVDQEESTRQEMRWMSERFLAIKRLERLRQEKKKGVDFEKLARERYAVSGAKLTRAEEVKAAHVLIKLTDRSDEEAKALAEEISQRAAKGEDFGELAKKYSEDPGSKIRGGDLGQFGRGKMIKPFEDAAFALKSPGDVSKPVKSNFGYHIIKLQSRQEAGVPPFDEVKVQLMKEVEDQFLAEEVQMHMAKVRGDPSIKIEEAVFRKLTSAPGKVDTVVPGNSPATEATEGKK